MPLLTAASAFGLGRRWYRVLNSVTYTIYTLFCAATTKCIFV